jgi:biotin operon repressor
MTRKNKTYISAEDFVRNYASASTAEELAKNLGVDVKYVLKRSNQLRKNGVQLRELSCNYVPLRSGRKSLDHDHISRLARECQAVAAKKSTQDVLTNSINQAITNANG